MPSTMNWPRPAVRSSRGALSLAAVRAARRLLVVTVPGTDLADLLRTGEERGLGERARLQRAGRTR
ncbi:hypothetical protein WB401_18635 [Streptomyces brasiliscabiei]|uniref:Uncharacterized protein n=1 Tax=Streptomyces brasiliscabiei TaxID=2736302 RepID=A0ABU8GBN2_9ACTN